LENFSIKKINNKFDWKLFHKVPKLIYKEDKNYISVLENDIEKSLDTIKNIFFKEDGFCKIYVVLNSQNLPVGRIACFTNRELLANKNGYIGFFESINNQQVANLLIHKACEDLKEIGCQTILASVNPGARDSFWGILQENNHKPSYSENYNPPFYKELFFKAGFLVDFEQQTYTINEYTYQKKRIDLISERVLKRGDITWSYIDFKQKKKYIEEFITIYNQAWAGFDFFKPVNYIQIEKSFKELKMIAMDNLICFVYVKDEPAGYFVCVPDINEVIQKMNTSRLNWWNSLFLLYKLKTHSYQNLKALVFGIIPKYQGIGLEAVLMKKIHLTLESMPNYKQTELAWIGDFNPKMQLLMEGIGAIKYKKHLTLKKTLN